MFLFSGCSTQEAGPADDLVRITKDPSADPTARVPPRRFVPPRINFSPALCKTKPTETALPVETQIVPRSTARCLKALLQTWALRRRATSFPGRRDSALLLDTPTPRATRLSAGFVWAPRDKPACSPVQGFFPPVSFSVSVI